MVETSVEAAVDEFEPIFKKRKIFGDFLSVII